MEMEVEGRIRRESPKTRWKDCNVADSMETVWTWLRTGRGGGDKPNTAAACRNGLMIGGIGVMSGKIGGAGVIVTGRSRALGALCCGDTQRDVFIF